MTQALPNVFTILNSTYAREVLGVSKSASPQEIKVAYRALVNLYHPDRDLNNPQFESIFKRVALAKELLDKNIEVMTNRTDGRPDGRTDGRTADSNYSNQKSPSEPKPTSDSWKMGDPQLAGEAIEFAKMNNFYQFPNFKWSLLIPWNYELNHVFQYSTHLSEVQNAITKTYFYKNEGKTYAAISFNKLLQNFSEQIADSFQLEAFNSLIQRYAKSRENELSLHTVKIFDSRLGDKDAPRFAHETGLFLGGLVSQLRAALSVHSVASLDSFRRMNDLFIVKGYRFYYDNGVLDFKQYVNYVTNVQRYFSAFAEDPEKQIIIAEMFENAMMLPYVLNELRAPPNPRKYSNSYASAAWHFLDLWTVSNSELLAEINFDEIDSARQYQVFKNIYSQYLKEKMSLGQAVAHIKYALAHLSEEPSPEEAPIPHKEEESTQAETTSTSKCTSALDLQTNLLL
jgi:hypothetical protein